MGTTAYDVAFTAEDYLRICIVSERGRVVSFTVQYEAVIGGVTVSRRPLRHRDLLDAQGRNIEKHWMPGWDYKVALDYARDDLVQHWPRYRADFITRMS